MNILLLFTCILLISCSRKDQKSLHPKVSVETTSASTPKEKYDLKGDVSGMQLRFYYVNSHGNRESVAERLYMFDSSGAIVSISGSVDPASANPAVKQNMSDKDVLYTDSRGENKGFENVLEYNYLENYALKQKLIFTHTHQWISYRFGQQRFQDDDGLMADDPVFEDTIIKKLNYTEFDSLGNWVKCGEEIERKIFYTE